MVLDDLSVPVRLSVSCSPPLLSAHLACVHSTKRLLIYYPLNSVLVTKVVEPSLPKGDSRWVGKPVSQQGDNLRILNERILLNSVNMGIKLYYIPLLRKRPEYG